MTIPLREAINTLRREVALTPRIQMNDHYLIIIPQGKSENNSYERMTERDKKLNHNVSKCTS